jgi:hypothetical protein
VSRRQIIKHWLTVQNRYRGLGVGEDREKIKLIAE